MLVKYIFLLQTLQVNDLVLDFPGFGGSRSDEFFSIMSLVDESSSILHTEKFNCSNLLSLKKTIFYPLYVVASAFH